MDELDNKLDEAVSASLSIRKAQPNETTEDAPNKVQWFRPNGGELWFFEFDKEAVKQAFIENGWVDSVETAKYIAENSVNIHTYRNAFIGPDSINSVGLDVQPPDIKYHVPGEVFGAELMTGQEWYDRFEKELNKFEGNYHKWVGSLPSEVLEAAKKAAGIEG